MLPWRRAGITISALPTLSKRFASPTLLSSSPVVTQLSTRRHRLGDSGENDSGHIGTSPQQGILFFNNILPPNLHWFFRYTTDLEKDSASLAPNKTPRFKAGLVGVVHPEDVFRAAVKQAGIPGAVHVDEVLPRLREGGAFLKFTHDGAADSESIAAAMRSYLNDHPRSSWWNFFASVKSGLVRGTPWIEDLARLPSRRLCVEFLPTEPGGAAAELSPEQLYSFFRPFGKLKDIHPQPSDSKIVPRYADIDYGYSTESIMARNCLHGYVVSDAQGGGKAGTILRLTYARKDRAGWVKDWIVGHPRVMLPLIAALVASITVAIFDPLRTLSIQAHITRAFHVEDNAVFRWFQRQSEDLLNRVRQAREGPDPSGAGLEAVWQGRKDQIEEIQSWMMEDADTFVIVQGPRGSGKREFVIDHALRHKRDAHRLLLIDCKAIQEARGDAATITAAAAQVGYRPVFSWMNSISGLLDLAAQGMTGVKAGFSETLENQLNKIWNKTSTALKRIALEGRRKDDLDAKLGDDEYLEAHPERRPVVVIDNFLHKNSEPGAALVNDKLAEWAARLTTSNIAHVVFLTNDVSYGKSLSRALPDRVFHQISLGDCSPEVAKRYVITHLDFDATASKVHEENEDLGENKRLLTPSQKRKDLGELDSVIDQLGGRLTDLEFLARRIKAGESPARAVREIVDQSVAEIMRMFLLQLPGSSSGEQRAWTAGQAWTLVRQLASQDQLRYNEVLFSDPFKSASTPGAQALLALERAELITVQSFNSRPCSIKPGKPVYARAFQQLLNDRVLAATLDLSLLTDAMASETRSIDKYEQELRLLGELPQQPAQLRDRIRWLLAKVQRSQTKLESLEKQSAALKAVLTSEY